MPDLWDVLFDNPTTADDLSIITAPTLVVRGGCTTPAETAICDVVNACVPDSQMIVVPGAGHLVSLTHAVELAGAVAAHVCSVTSETAGR
jgi:pimeloyl-ACP methyl ester carboxylesterase